MKKILAMIRGLPPEMRMLVAMAGLGTPLGLIYAVQRFLFPGVPVFYVILGCAALVAVIAFLGLIISRIFGGRAKKRRKDMERELSAAGPSGPVGMDARAAIKGNNEKFFNAIRDMRKTLGLNVYDLPWYVVIGDSGCGKTKLINEGGLVFSTGRPEGYQLGTLNYNWWFTEDAIFIDMAGRLCNPQEDADRREWTAFLDTVAKGRKGYPINGAIVCVSADHLLADPPEKQEQDANTMLERLRDLQNRLGVTFATYLVLTKCDKILGFMPFFDRPGKDITFKNQMFGWSKPGAYNELVDPEKFDQYFDDLYHRLCELRLRRISEDADELELGLAYTFPEEFRTLREPLKIYLRTLFPAIKNPKAIKNLLFRGLYLTSATQEGEVVLKHLRQRLGEDAARQFQPLESLYPQPRPHFVKDLLVRKVIPENGLVFRNEQEVARNRKLARLLFIGSGVMSLALIGMLIWSFMAFGKLIGKPRTVSGEVTRQFESKSGYPAETSLAKTTELNSGVVNLRENPWAARLLSMGVGTNEPIRGLTKVEMRLFEEGVLRPMLREVENGLRNPPAERPPQEYRDALLVYARWAGCANAEATGVFEESDLSQLAKAIPDDRRGWFKDDQVLPKWNAYLTSIKEGPDWSLKDGVTPNPARLLTDPEGTLPAALAQVHGQFLHWAKLSDQHPDPTIREWMRLAYACQDVSDAYEAMVGNLPENQTLNQLIAFSGSFTEQFKKFEAAKEACSWTLNQKDPAQNRVVIHPLRKTILARRTEWLEYEANLRAAYAKCGNVPATQPGGAQQFLALLSHGDQAAGRLGLDQVLAESLRDDAGLTDRDYVPDFFGDLFSQRVKEVTEQYEHIITLVENSKSGRDDTITPTKDTVTVHDRLKGINQWMSGLNLQPNSDLSGETLDRWRKELDERLYGSEKSSEKVAVATAPLDLQYKEPWRQNQLAALLAKYIELGARGEGNRLLLTIRYRLDQVGEWGLAEVCRGWRNMSDAHYHIEQPRAATAAAVAAPAPETAPTEQAPAAPTRPQRRSRRLSDSSPPPAPQAAAPTAAAPAPSPTPSQALPPGVGLPEAARATFLNQALDDLTAVEAQLRDLQPEDYLPSPDAAEGDLPKQCLDRLQAKTGVYLQRYVTAWGEAYKAKDETALKQLEERARTAGSINDLFPAAAAGGQNEMNKIAREAREALREVLRHVRWATVREDGKTWEQVGGSHADVPGYQEDWRALLTAWRAAVNDRWPKDGASLASEALPPAAAADNVRPWDAAAGELESAWNRLAGAILKNVPLPDKFDNTTKMAEEIPWQVMDEFRAKWLLDDQQVTGRLSAVAEQGRQLLNRELSRNLYGVQQRQLGGASADGGWPYVSGGAGGDALDYAQFKKFLAEVSFAEQSMKPLEKGIPDNPLKAARAAFYDACREWSDCLGAQPGAAPKSISMDVLWQDPLTDRLRGMAQKLNIQDTAQFYYNKVRLNLGLSTGGQSGNVLEVETKRQEAYPTKATWNWTGSADSAMTLVFAEPIRNVREMPPRTLGRLSPLSFCVYLHRYGQEISDRNWVTMHAFNLADVNYKPENDKSILGAAVEFKLDRAIPRPIVPISAP